MFGVLYGYYDTFSIYPFLSCTYTFLRKCNGFSTKHSRAFILAPVNSPGIVDSCDKLVFLLTLSLYLFTFYLVYTPLTSFIEYSIWTFVNRYRNSVTFYHQVRKKSLYIAISYLFQYFHTFCSSKIYQLLCINKKFANVWINPFNPLIPNLTHTY